VKPEENLACPACGGQDIEIAVFDEPPFFVGMECSCGWTCEGDGIDWRAQLVPYQGDSTDEEGASLSVEDAADIWLSHGMDEDYTFGYDERDLRRAAGLD
jgi:hypothetical protein